ncbi:MAG: DUF1501 domain-containing protein [Candidatus Hinthialibacter antarcticus]|nr:DUF1501 domain-containing protein [Candidatus Hinthialibacter antarcticus]
MQDALHKLHLLDRRRFLNQTSLGMGAVALNSLLAPGVNADQRQSSGGVLNQLHFPARAKRVIYLFQSGGPSQMELFDYKPMLDKMHGQQLPDSVRKGQRLTGMSGGQSSLPLARSIFSFAQHGNSGSWVSELMPHTAKIVDELCFIHSMHTEAINHDPAITFFQTGSQLPGRPSIGSWLSYGLGTDNKDLPEFIVLVSKNGSGQPLYARLWGSGFLPSKHQGVQFRSGADPVLYLKNPEGYHADDRKGMLDALKQLEQAQHETVGDPEINNRLAQYEMAYRMQMSVPEALDLSDEPESIFEQYGPDAKDPGTYAYNCLLARRLAERDVKFIQLYHQGWDQHGNLPNAIKKQCRATDQASAALVMDLKQRGLLDDTLVIWGGEFGRTNYSQGQLTEEDYGRDHHPRCFTIWMAGAGVKAGLHYGTTDELGYNITENPVHVHDFQATLLHLLGVDHEKLAYKFQGRRFRLTDVHGKVVHDLIA